jgi:hypothetical protein
MHACMGQELMPGVVSPVGLYNRGWCVAAGALHDAMCGAWCTFYMASAAVPLLAAASFASYRQHMPARREPRASNTRDGPRPSGSHKAHTALKGALCAL